MINLVEECRNKEIKAIVDYVRDGSTLHVYLLPDYHHVRVFVAGVQVKPRHKFVSYRALGLLALRILFIIRVLFLTRHH